MSGYNTGTTTGFSVGGVFTESLRFVRGQLRAVFILACVPYGLYLLATIAARTLFTPEVTGFDLRPDGQYALDGLTFVDLETNQIFDLEPHLYFQFFLFLLALVIPLPFKVAWLRYTLLGPRHEPVRAGYRFGDREVRFLGYTLGVLVAMFAVGAGGAAVAGLIGGIVGSAAIAVIFTIAAVALVLWVTARLYFVFPPLVLELPTGFKRAWRESRGQAVKLIVLSLMIVLIFWLPAMLISALIGGIPLIGDIAGTIIVIVADAALWTALGFAYWRTTGISGTQGAVAKTN